VGIDFDIQRWMKLSQVLFSIENFEFSSLGYLLSTATVFDGFDVSSELVAAKRNSVSINRVQTVYGAHPVSYYMGTGSSHG